MNIYNAILKKERLCASSGHCKDQHYNQSYLTPLLSENGNEMNFEKVLMPEVTHGIETHNVIQKF